MTNNELLLAISDMFDTKLKAELKPIKEDIRVLKEDVRVLKDDVRVLKDDVQILYGEVRLLKDNVQILNDRMQTVEDRMQAVESNLHQMKLCQENIIMPRLNTIESCYTDTYGRYKSYADKMEASFDDVDLLKRVVTEHSVKLQKLA